MLKINSTNIRGNMHRCSLLVISVLSIFIGFGQNKTNKNIIFIITDDHAYQAISAYNSRFAKIAPTPNIDKLANEGVRFDRSYVGNSICAPSRATMLTGKHSHLNGITTLKEKFDGNQPTIANILQKNGYETTYFGKWHLKSSPVGFSAWDVLIGQGDYYNSDFKTEEGITRSEGYTTDVITDKAINWLDNQREKDKPFMMIVGHKAPHANWLPPVKYLSSFDEVEIPEPKNLFDKHISNGLGTEEIDMTIEEMPKGWYCQLWTEKKAQPNRYEDLGGVLWKRAYGRLTKEEKASFDKVFNPENEAFIKANLKWSDLIRWKYQRILKNYLGCVKSVDDNVGRITNYVKNAGLEDDTLIIYASDQGLFLGEHGWYDKRMMYEDAFRTPLIVSCPSISTKGIVSNQLVQNIDYAPTILDFAGVEIPSDMQGESLLPILKNKKAKNWRKSLYYQYYDYPGGHDIQKQFPN